MSVLSNAARELRIIAEVIDGDENTPVDYQPVVIGLLVGILCALVQHYGGTKENLLTIVKNTYPD
jgi:hypothetical protein